MIDSTPAPDSPDENPDHTRDHSHGEANFPDRDPEFDIAPEHRAAIEALVAKWKQFDFSNQNLTPAAGQFLPEWREAVNFEHVGGSTAFICGQIFLPGLDSLFGEPAHDSEGNLIPPEVRVDTSVSPNILRYGGSEPGQMTMLEFLESFGFGQDSEHDMGMTELFNKAFASSMTEVVAVWKAGLAAQEGEEIEYEKNSLTQRIAGIEQRLADGSLSARDQHLTRELLKKFSADLAKAELNSSDPLRALGLEIEMSPTEIIFRSAASEEQLEAYSRPNQMSQWVEEQETRENAFAQSLIDQWRTDDFQTRVNLSVEARTVRQDWLNAVTAEQVADGLSSLSMLTDGILSGGRTRGAGRQRNDRTVTLLIEDGALSATLSSNSGTTDYNHDELKQGFHDYTSDNGEASTPTHSEIMLAYALSSLPDIRSSLDHGRSHIAVEAPDETTLIVRTRTREELAEERRLDTTPTFNYLGLTDSEELVPALQHLSQFGAVIGEREGAQYPVEDARIVSFDYLDEVYRVVHPAESAGEIIHDPEAEQYVVARRVAGERGLQLPVVVPSNRRDELIRTPGVTSVSGTPIDTVMM